MTETRLENELVIKVLTSEESLYCPNARVRSDQLPSLPKNFFFGTMEVLEKPEPIAPRRTKRN